MLLKKKNILTHIDKMKSKSERSQIKVFITKTQEFRVRIRLPEISYEVTVGGKSWKEGKGREFEEIIKRKCELLVTSLSTKLNNF